MPATGFFSGAPPSSRASVAAQTVAMEEEPFDSRMSETMRTVYGNSASGRHHVLDRPLGERCRARSRGVRWYPSRPTSPTENGGKL